VLQDGGQDAQFPHAQDGILIVNGLASAHHGNDAMADVDAALGCDLEVALHNVAQIGIPVKVHPGLVPERLQSG